MTTCIFKFPNAKDHQFGHKTASYRINDLWISTDVIGHYSILIMFEGVQIKLKK